jgi:hypothetical protein
VLSNCDFETFFLILVSDSVKRGAGGGRGGNLNHLKFVVKTKDRCQGIAPPSTLIMFLRVRPGPNVVKLFVHILRIYIIS